ncbi:hypothetical protein GSY74_03025 [Sulfurovum sp. bin170]|uniref:hypothetical protein n=1 Tax=Sulfurovum sp. bin170 TaxID=2695268 RepID=UPI0013DFEC8E|nr:hypothetical protein [Sulfurovum sp. bin170]NEW60246.1 hypothetical protein [Sulfurovum sp. bin170]
MIYRSLLLTTVLFFAGCSTKHQINIGEISLQKGNTQESISKDRYMSFTQEYYDNKRYPVSEYCDDKRAILTDDKFSTETYLKITNERTKQNRVGKYPIWFLVNDDEHDMQCIKKSANFINEEPFVVGDSDHLSVKLLQKNKEEKSVPVKELGILIDFVGLVVPQTANFLMRSSNLINDPITRNYLDTMENAFKSGDLDGTKSRDFDTKVESIKVKLNVPDGQERRELGYILLKPKYRTTLSTVDLIKGVPNFRYIYNSGDPRTQDIMNYQLKSKGITVGREVDNFKHVAGEYIIEALSSLNVHLLNRFTSYDRGLVLSLALRQSSFYRGFAQAVKSKDTKRVGEYLTILNSEDNPLRDLSTLLNQTRVEYYTLMFQANKMVKSMETTRAEEIKEQERLKDEEAKRLIALQGIENFLYPVARGSYIARMFDTSAEIKDTSNKKYDLEYLQDNYSREEGVVSYGCYVNLQANIGSFTVQDYLIHPNYTDGEKYNYMAISMDEDKKISTFFYKLTSNGNLKITKILIDKDYFIRKSRLKDVIKGQKAKMCYQNIMSLL